MGIDIYAVLVNHQSAVAMKEKSGVDYDILYDENLAMARQMGLIQKDAVPTNLRMNGNRRFDVMV